MDTAYFYLTAEGKELVHRLSADHPGDIFGKENFKESLRNGFHQYDYLVCVMATGIVVRILAPLIEKKTSDPGVVVLDQHGRFAISLLSGHLGGANDLAREMAVISGGTPVITTATDVAGELSFDTFAKSHNLAIENIGTLKHISGTLLDQKPVQLVAEASWFSCPEIKTDIKRGRLIPIVIPQNISEKIPENSPESDQNNLRDFFSQDILKDIPTVVIHEGIHLGDIGDNKGEAKGDSMKAPVLYLRPRTIHAGIGCKRDMDGEQIYAALLAVLSQENLHPLSLASIATIPLKAGEPGIINTADRLSVPLTIIPTEEIEKLDIETLGISPSEFVAKQTGVLSVSTASAYISSGKGTILRDKVKFKGITIALAKS